MSARKRRTPYQRIYRAAQNGTGVHLKADDVWALANDDAIQERARLDDEEETGEPKPPSETKP